MMRDLGVDVVHVGEINAATADDEEILEAARADGRTVVTLDSDFHAIMALSGQKYPSVVRIRIEGVKAPWLVGLLEMVIDRCAAQLESGALVTVTESKLRVRRLPIGR